MTLGPFIGFTDVQEEGFVGVQLKGGFDIGYTEQRAGGMSITIFNTSDSGSGGRKGGDGWEDEEDGKNLHGELLI
jgi:hypothetical protein